MSTELNIIQNYILGGGVQPEKSSRNIKGTGAVKKAVRKNK